MVGHIVSSKNIGMYKGSTVLEDASVLKSYEHNIPLGALSFEVWSSEAKRQYGLRHQPEHPTVWKLSVVISADDRKSLPVQLKINFDDQKSPVTYDDELQHANADDPQQRSRYWIPLNKDESAKLRSKLRGLVKEPLSIWCNGDNCRDLAETVKVAFHQSSWDEPQIQESIFPLNFVGMHIAPETEKTKAIANAVEEATAGRLVLRVESEPTNDKMINIAIGRKR